MILGEDLIKEYILKPYNGNINDYRKEHDRLDIYYNGGDISSEIEKITSFENDAQKKLRDDIARSPKELVQRLLNQFNKIFTASGGSNTFDFEVEKQQDEFIDNLAKLPEGISLNKWMQDYWFEAYITDPNGIIFIESETNDDPKSYPTYKSINTIHDYKLTWSNFEYLILNFGKFIINDKEVKVYRVIDDEKDGLYYMENQTLMEFGDDAIITHENGFVPAVLMSDLIDKKTGGKKSFIHSIEEILTEYVRESSVLSIFKFLHAYPKYWQYVSKCTKCSGTGKIPDPQDETSKITCTSCGGKKFNLKLDVSDGIMLPLPKTSTDPVLAPNIAGFSVPPIDAWDKMEASLDRLEKKMQFAIIGTYLEEEKSNTATGRFIDTQPLDTALHKFSESEENIKNKVADFIARWMFGNDYGSLLIKNGKRFISEHPDTIWVKYIEAKNNSAPITSLNYLYKQYLMSEYQNNADMYEQKLKEFLIEPLVHYSIKEIDDLSSVTMAVQVQEKIYFSEWLNTTTDFTKDVEILRTEFQEFINQKDLKDESIKEN